MQRESLGPAIELKPGYETFWAYIPHFIHSPFYVYAYAFGDCLVNSLYAVYERAAEGFAERYLAMLAAGGTKHHSELLAPFGLDARDPAFWQGGLGVIERMIDGAGKAWSERCCTRFVKQLLIRSCEVVVDRHAVMTTVVSMTRPMKLGQSREIGNSDGLILPRELHAASRHQAMARQFHVTN